MVDPDDEQVDPAATSAAERMTYQLTYTRADTQRRFQPGLLTGPSLPCAYGSDITASGDWEDPADYDHHPDRTEDDWIDRYASYAVHEAVHEALEWLCVRDDDGKTRRWLNPHGRAQREIYAAVDELVGRLAEIRSQSR